MSRHKLTDCPTFISNLAVLLSEISNILHDIDASKAPKIKSELDRMWPMLSIAQESCTLFVEAVERGPDYVTGGAS